MLLLKGIILGFSIAAPVGPIGLLCVRRTMQYGFIAGISGGFGTAAADALYATIAAFGLTAITSFMIRMQPYVQFLGGVFLLWLACKSLVSPASKETLKVNNHTLLMTFITTFFLTLTNPATIISFTALFASLGLAAQQSYQDAIFVVTGTFLGSMLWWCFLSGLVRAARTSRYLENLRWINYMSAFILAIFGGWAIFRVIASQS